MPPETWTAFLAAGPALSGRPLPPAAGRSPGGRRPGATRRAA